MKKIMAKRGTILVLIFVLSALILAGCGASASNGSATTAAPAAKEDLGTWYKTIYSKSANEFATMFRTNFDSLTLFSDNSYKLEKQYCTYVSTDGGETYVLRATNAAYILGKYEVVESNDELGEKTVKLSDISKVTLGDTSFDITNGDFSVISKYEVETVGQTLLDGMFGIDKIPGQSVIIASDGTLDNMFGNQAQ